MSALSIRLPESLHRNARAYAEQEGVSVNQLVTTALAEKLAALAAEEYLSSRSKRASPAGFKRALARVPATVADPEDQRGSAPARSGRPRRPK